MKNVDNVKREKKTQKTENSNAHTSSLTITNVVIPQKIVSATKSINEKGERIKEILKEYFDAIFELYAQTPPLSSIEFLIRCKRLQVELIQKIYNDTGFEVTEISCDKIVMVLDDYEIKITLKQ